jgi:hypothetical protein
MEEIDFWHRLTPDAATLPPASGLCASSPICIERLARAISRCSALAALDER